MLPTFGVLTSKKTIVGEHAARFNEKMHRIVSEMLDDLGGDHQVKMPVGIRKPIALGVEAIHVAGELAIREGNDFAIGSSKSAKIRAAHFPIAAQSDRAEA